MPFNEMMPDAGCDSGPALTGCVVTAWGQLMRYWRWPYKGSGAHEQYWQGQYLSVDYDATSLYDWDNMPGVLTGDSSQVQKDAVG